MDTIKDDVVSMLIEERLGVDVFVAMIMKFNCDIIDEYD